MVKLTDLLRGETPSSAHVQELQRAMHRHWDDVVHVRDYGAVGNGRTDDTTALLAALADALARDGILYIDPGTYVFSETLNIIDIPNVVYNRITIEGAGAECSVLVFDNTDGSDAIYVLTRGLERIVNLRNFSLRSQESASRVYTAQSNGIHAILLQHGWEMSGLTIRGFNATDKCAMLLQDCIGGTIRDVSIRDGYHGIKLCAGSDATRLYDTVCYWMQGNCFWCAEEYIYNRTPPLLYTPVKPSFYDCYVYGGTSSGPPGYAQTSTGFLIQGSDDVIIVNPWVEQCKVGIRVDYSPGNLDPNGITIISGQYWANVDVDIDLVHGQGAGLFRINSGKIDIASGWTRSQLMGCKARTNNGVAISQLYYDSTENDILQSGMSLVADSRTLERHIIDGTAPSLRLTADSQEWALGWNATNQELVLRDDVTAFEWWKIAPARFKLMQPLQLQSCPSTDRPDDSLVAGMSVWDEVLSLPIYWDGSQYIEADGTVALPAFLVYTTPTVTPALSGSELLTNSGMETGQPPTGWPIISADGSVAGVADERTGGGGVQSVSIVNGASGLTEVSQTPTIATGIWCRLSGWGKHVSANLRLRAWSYTAGVTLLDIVFSAASWAQKAGSFRTTTSNMRCRLVVDSITVDLDVRADDLSWQAYTLSSIVALAGDATKKDANYDCFPVLADLATERSQCGMVVCCDADTPTYGLWAYHDGTTVYLVKEEASVYAGLIAVEATYIPGRKLRIVVSGTSVSLFYNSVQISTTQTVANIASYGTRVYGFSTYAGNSTGMIVAQG